MSLTEIHPPLRAAPPLRPTVTFYYPRRVENPSAIPECLGRYEGRKSGNYIWPVKTYGYLSAAGVECRLAEQMPEEGIVITHRDWLPNSLRPNGRQLLVCVVADMIVHPYAQVQLLQNQADPLLTADAELWPSFFMPLWTESGLRGRDASRGDRFENIGFMGSAHNLAPQMKTGKWRARLAELGLRWVVAPPDSWHDYSALDAVLAVRSFSSFPRYRYPATKLFNAWAAGVPAIFGPESALRAERRGPLDYLEVGSPREAVAALDRLRKDPSLREAMVANGLVRALEHTPQKTTGQWTRLLADELPRLYQQWSAADEAYRRDFLARRRAAYRELMLRELGASVYWRLARFIAQVTQRL